MCDLGQAHPAVLTGDLDAETAEVGPALDVGIGYARLALDDGAVKGGAIVAQLVQERGAPPGFVDACAGMRVDEV